MSYDGGGELLAALLGSQVKAGFTGTGEIEEQARSGQLRVLAVTSEEPVEGIDAPTLQDEGIDLTFTNWRGVVAAGGLSDEQTEQLVGAMERMHDSEEWKAALDKNGWIDASPPGRTSANSCRTRTTA